MTSHHKDNDHRFNEASAMVLAASDLLRVACNNNEQLNASLDNNSLKNLAEAIYREVQVAEMLYIQLREMFDQSRNEKISLYTSYPQVSIPLSRLNLPQLQHLFDSAMPKLETYEAEENVSSQNPSQQIIEHLRCTVEDIQLEISKRGQ